MWYLICLPCGFFLFKVYVWMFVSKSAGLHVYMYKTVWSVHVCVQLIYIYNMCICVYIYVCRCMSYVDRCIDMWIYKQLHSHLYTYISNINVN